MQSTIIRAFPHELIALRIGSIPSGEHMTETIDGKTLSELVEAGAVKGVHIVGQKGGWTVVVCCGTTEMPLAAQRNNAVRNFRKLETLVSYLRGIGIQRFDVDAIHYDPADRTVAHDVWFREQVKTSIDDPRPSISSEAVEAKFAAKRAALRNLSGPLPAHLQHSNSCR